MEPGSARHSSTLLPPPSSRLSLVPDRVNDIVLLEDGDLYKYHRSPEQVEEPHSRACRASARPSALTTVSYQTSDYPGTADITGTTNRQYRLFAAPSTGQKSTSNTISSGPIAYGAIRPGGPVNLFESRSIGLLINWIIIGFLNGAIPAITPPLLLSYLGFNDSQYTAVNALLTMPWGIKFLLAFLVDCVPIHRQRRKPYLLIGWSTFLMFMMTMVIIGPPAQQTDLHPTKTDKASSAWGMRYIILMVVNGIAHMLNTVAAEGLMVEHAQREGEYERGKAQSWCLIAFFAGQGTGTISVGLALNNHEYGGDFTYAVPLRLVFATFALLTLAGIAATKFCIVEHRTSSSAQPFKMQLRRVWSILQERTTWQITVFGFLYKVSTVYEVQELLSIYKDWLGAVPLTLNLANALTDAGSLTAIALFMVFLINSNWRTLLMSSTLISLVMMVPVDMITVFNVARSQTLYLAKAQATALCDAFVLALSQIMIVEVAEPGYEAVTYGVITTVISLGTNAVTMMKNLVATSFADKETNLVLDSDAVRQHLLHEFLFKYALRLLMLAFLIPLLPRQRRHLQEIKALGNPTLVIPILIFFMFAIVYVVAVVSIWLAAFESTRCLVFAGGKGCSEV